MNNFKDRLYRAYVTSGQANYSFGSNKRNIFSNREHYIKRIIDTHLSSTSKNARIVDIACGNGSFVHFLQKSGFSNVFGFDISAEQIQVGQALGISNIQVMDFNQFLADANQKADVFVLMDILEHLDRDEIFTLLDELLLRLNDDGMLLIHVPNAEGIFGMRVRYGDLTHEISFTTKSMSQLLNTIGFRSVNCFEDKPVIHGFKSFIRRILWTVFTLPIRLIFIAETGNSSILLSQNMVVKAVK